MSARGKSRSTWDTFLWLGVGILVLVFLYELVTLWAKAGATFNNLGSLIGQAFQNAVADVETGFANLLAAPVTFFNNLTLGLSTLFSLFWPFVGGILTSLFGTLIPGIPVFFSDLFSGNLAQLTGTGSNYPATTIEGPAVTAPSTTPDPGTVTNIDTPNGFSAGFSSGN